MSRLLALNFDYNTTMFRPRYEITHALVGNVRAIGQLIGELNSKTLSQTVLAEFERDARALSAFSSTQIEGNPLPLTDVKRIIRSRPARVRDTEREVLNYNRALVFLDGEIKKDAPLTNKFICAVHRMVMDRLAPKHQAGVYRREPVFVNNPIKGQTVYLPPDAKDVLPLMTDLVNFANASQGKIDPLLIAGLFHKQVVVIHPFMDGNGRTTRLITKTLLARLGINTFPLFSFENYYNRNVSRYFEQVGVFGNYYEIVDKIDFTQWLEYFTDGIIDELQRVTAQLPARQPRLMAHHQQILAYIREHGSIAMRDYTKITPRARSTRIKDLAQLVEMQLIEPREAGKATYYVMTGQ